MAKRKAKPKTIQHQLIEHIEAADISRAELSRQTGIPESNLSAFVSGNRGLSIESINAIGLALKLEMVRRGNE